MIFAICYIATWAMFAIVPNNETNHERDMKQMGGY